MQKWIWLTCYVRSQNLSLKVQDCKGARDKDAQAFWTGTMLKRARRDERKRHEKEGPTKVSNCSRSKER